MTLSSLTLTCLQSFSMQFFVQQIYFNYAN